jgi:hypothetical protein
MALIPTGVPAGYDSASFDGSTRGAFNQTTGALLVDTPAVVQVAPIAPLGMNICCANFTANSTAAPLSSSSVPCKSVLLNFAGSNFLSSQAYVFAVGNSYIQMNGFSGNGQNNAPVTVTIPAVNLNQVYVSTPGQTSNTNMSFLYFT